MQTMAKRRILSTCMNRLRYACCLLECHLLFKLFNPSDERKSSGFSGIISVYISKGPFFCIRPDIRATGKEQRHRQQAEESTCRFITELDKVVADAVTPENRETALKSSVRPCYTSVTCSYYLRHRCWGALDSNYH